MKDPAPTTPTAGVVRDTLVVCGGTGGQCIPCPDPVWVLPPLVLLGCLLGLLRFIRRERAEAEALPDEVPAEIENEYLKTIRQDVLH